MHIAYTTHTHYTHYIHYTNYILSFMGVNILLLITLFLKVLNPSCCKVLNIKTVMCKTINVKVFSSWQKPISPHVWWQLKGTCPSYNPSLYTANTYIQFIYVLHSLIIIYKITYKCFRSDLFLLFFIQYYRQHIYISADNKSACSR